MKKLYCEACGKETRCFVACPLYGHICMDHCQACRYWTGRMAWNCTYKEPVMLLDTRAARAVERFRMMYRCWYCGKQLYPWETVRVVIADGSVRIVCKEDRACRQAGIQGHGTKPRRKAQPKTKMLERMREKHNR